MNRKYILIVFSFACFGFFASYLIYSNRFLQWIFEEKIWVHRVNSIEKLREVETKFYGVELDVVFIDSLKKFDINHPPEPSIQLYLEKYLTSIKNNSSLHFWLDFKNLDTQNQQNALNKLNNICDSLKLLRNKFIVESSNVSLLNKFSNAGYKTSYYMHWPGLYSLKNNKFNAELTQIESKITTLNYQGFLSSDYRDYEILKENFPNHHILLWLDYPFGKENKLNERLQLYKMLSDKKVKILLMKYKSKLNER